MSEKKNELNLMALEFHKKFPAGKIQIMPTKDVVKNINLAYSPGVAAPCLEINLRPETARQYTNISNSVAIISNGTAVLGLGKLGALASKPVMEGKAALFKVLAGIDCIDIEIEERNPEKFVEYVTAISTTFGGINLEDIASPECFEIETKLKEKLSIPVFHDDQHGTAIVVAAAVINAMKLFEKKISQIKVVVLGTGAAGNACAQMLLSMGVKDLTAFDSKGAIHKGRSGLDQYKAALAVDHDITLTEALKDADVFVGTSVANALKSDMVQKMAKNPLILALANPVPEIHPDDVYAVREDAIVCTGRSDLKNQVNNVLCFPYLFRVALDQNIEISDHLKMTVANSIADFARHSKQFDRDHIVPSTSDESIRYIMPGLILSNLASSNINIHEYSRNSVARRLMPHSYDVFNMSVAQLYTKLLPTESNAEKIFQIDSILAAWGYLPSESQPVLPMTPGHMFVNPLYISVVDGAYHLIHSGARNEIVEKLATDLKPEVDVCGTITDMSTVVGVIENYETAPVLYYNPDMPADELALFSIMCSNISSNAAS